MPRPTSSAARAAACALALAVVSPAAAYLPPATAILKRTVQHRDELRIASLEVRGTLALSGETADRARAVAGLAGDTVPALLLMKTPGRCRLELASQGTPASARPSITVRAGRIGGARGLAEVGALRALVEAVCTVLAERAAPGDPERHLGQRLADRGVDLREVTLGRYRGRVVWILGGRERDARPQAWIDKQTFQPVRLIADAGGALRDVRFLDPGAPSERFPQNVEVWAGGQLEARLSADVVVPNPRLPDAAFP